MTVEQAKTELINILTNQVADLTMMSKIELGDDVIAEIKRLKDIIKQQHIIDKAYDNYRDKCLFNTIDCHCDMELNKPNPTFIPYNQYHFINKCKTDSAFSNKWGLKIEERELSLEERKVYAIDVLGYESLLDYGHNKNEEGVFIKLMNKWNIPTKLITIIYNNKMTESYEN